MKAVLLSFLALLTWTMMICPVFGQEANGKLANALNLMQGTGNLFNESKDSSQPSPVSKTDNTATASATSASGTSPSSSTNHSDAPSTSNNISSSSTSPSSSSSSSSATSISTSSEPSPSSTYTSLSRSKSKLESTSSSSSSFSSTFDPPKPSHNDPPSPTHKVSTSHKFHTYVDVVTLYVDGTTSLSSRTTVVEETDSDNKDNTTEQGSESSFGTTVYQINTCALVTCFTALLLAIAL